MFDETQQEAWRKRYGTDSDSLPDLGRFLNHRSVRDYSEREISEEIVKGLFASAQSAATSSNLQLWSAISVQDSANRAKIAKLCADQKQVINASWFFCFCADVHRIREAALLAGENPAGLEYMEFFTMACIDATLAAERMVCAAESLGIGSCYIGALRNHPEKVKEALELPEGVFGVFGLSLGWPAEDCSAEIKPRLSQEQVWMREKYLEKFDFSEYDKRMSEFYESQSMKGDVTWTMRSGRRVTEKLIGSRDSQKEFVEKQGFAKQ